MTETWSPVPLPSPGPIPDAVHGRFVPGLPWDNLPPPVWEVEEGEPDPLADELRKLNEQYTALCEELDEAEDAVRDAERAKEDCEDEITAKVAAYAKYAPGPAAALVKELDLPVQP